MVAKTTSKKPQNTVVEFFDPFAAIDGVLDSLEKNNALSNSVLDHSEKRVSTGLLSLDIVLGGGIVGGSWVTILGLEQSAKSTLTSTIMANMMTTQLPVVTMFDYEGSSSPEYIEGIMQSFLEDINTYGINKNKVSIQDLFGLRDPVSNKWVKKPRVRYYSDSILEKFFDFIADLQRTMPDKVRIGDDWFYVFENTKSNIKLVGNRYDEAYFRSSGKLRVPAQDSSLQALLIVDSYPCMLPAKLDSNDAGSAMAVQARAFSENIRRIKGRMRSKRMTIVGVNQLRQKPGVVYGCLHGQNLLHIPSTDSAVQVLPINQAVNSEFVGNVVSLSPDQTLVRSPVTGHHHNGVALSKNSWVVLSTVPAGFDDSDLIDGLLHEVKVRGMPWGDFFKPDHDLLPSLLEASQVLNRQSSEVCVTLNHKVAVQGETDTVWLEAQEIVEGHLLISYVLVNQELFQVNRKVNLVFTLDDVATLTRIIANHSDEPYCLARGIISDTYDRLVALEAKMAMGAEAPQAEAPQAKAPQAKAPQAEALQAEALQADLETLSKTFLHMLASYHAVNSALNRMKERFLDGFDGVKYDISVGATGNYMAGDHTAAVLVSNSPEYEPCGSALASASDIRLKLTSRALSGVPYASAGFKGQIEEEPSVLHEGAKDKYRYVHVKAIKNKLSPPYLEAWLRLWISDGFNARGFDIVWDSFQYLLMTGQIKSTTKRDKLYLNFKRSDGSLLTNTTHMSWDEFKTLIIGNKDSIVEVCSKFGFKPCRLRRLLIKQAEAQGCSLYFENVSLNGYDVNKASGVRGKGHAAEDALEEQQGLGDDFVDDDGLEKPEHSLYQETEG